MGDTVLRSEPRSLQKAGGSASCFTLTDFHHQQQWCILGLRRRSMLIWHRELWHTLERDQWVLWKPEGFSTLDLTRQQVLRSITPANKQSPPWAKNQLSWLTDPPHVADILSLSPFQQACRSTFPLDAHAVTMKSLFVQRLTEEEILQEGKRKRERLHSKRHLSSFVRGGFCWAAEFGL